MLSWIEKFHSHKRHTGFLSGRLAMKTKTFKIGAGSWNQVGLKLKLCLSIIIIEVGFEFL